MARPLGKSASSRTSSRQMQITSNTFQTARYVLDLFKIEKWGPSQSSFLKGSKPVCIVCFDRRASKWTTLLSNSCSLQRERTLRSPGRSSQGPATQPRREHFSSEHKSGQLKTLQNTLSKTSTELNGRKQAL